LKELSTLAFFSSLSFILVSSKPNKLYLELSFNYLKLSEYNLAVYKNLFYKLHSLISAKIKLQIYNE
ncbi:hypothetical protein, partial [Francisella noatunensis]|uniref:hypothetical protein n=1 Tax=Francisella noatunensis TaxID=657445 RepID=UPI001F34E04B